RRRHTRFSRDWSSDVWSSDLVAADAWARAIVGHTSGLVSRRGEIRVLFANDVSAAGTLGRETLSLEPAVEGELSLRGTRELVLEIGRASGRERVRLWGGAGAV